MNMSEDLKGVEEGFSTSIYGEKIARELKADPMGTGKDMEKAYREMI